MMQHTIGDTPILSGRIGANLTGATLVVNVLCPDGTVVTSDTAGPGADPDMGDWTAEFGAGDLDQTGVHKPEVRVRFSSGDIETFALDVDGAEMWLETRQPYGAAPA